ncbi:outer membrane beta-barrel protein [Roseibaca sp. V10]|uniref:Outer membrane beta-barrel protein n=1 Tax=Roseinatronobacter domitianus TaxID=2940293 RepID=A0ABT0M2W6_9RHOB|nr:outer membrane beta-barrel protein [Roseibaca domitiana]MCL1629184.1 outer membrane beta-barrel protein [Roseibaca domitiana]
MKTTLVAAAISVLGSHAYADGHNFASAPHVGQMRDWSGAYAALGISYSMGSYTTTAGSAYNAPDAEGVGLSAILGYAMQDGGFVYGAELMGNMDRTDGSGADCGLGAGFTCRSSIRNYLAARVRVAYAFNDTLLFATLGYATDKQDHTIRNGGVKVGVNAQRHYGPTVGLGVAHALNDELSIRGDVEYYDFGDRTYNLTVPGATTIDTNTVSARISLMRRF